MTHTATHHRHARILGPIARLRRHHEAPATLPQIAKNNNPRLSKDVLNVITRFRLNRLHLGAFYQTSVLGTLWELLQAACGIGIFVAVVVVTYVYPQSVPPQPVPIISHWASAATAIFSVDLVFKIYTARDLPSYLWSWQNLLDVLVVLGPHVQSETTKLFYLAQSLRIFRTLGFLRLIQQRLDNGTSVTQAQQHHLLWNIIALMYTTTVIVLIIALWMTILEPQNIDYFHSGIYFAVITISTVGYGDIHPETVLGRLFIMTVLLVSLVVLPERLAKLFISFRSLELKRLGHKTSMISNHRSAPFVLVCGGFKPSDVYALVAEMNSNQSHDIALRLGLGANGMRLKFVSPRDPSSEMRECFADRMVQMCAEFVVADPGNTDDLLDVKADQAKAIFILSDNMLAGNHQESDSRAVMYTVCVLAVNRNAVLVVEVFSPLTRATVVSLGVTFCFCLREVNGMLAGRNLCCFGFSTLFFNLLTTANKTEDKIHFQNKNYQQQKNEHQQQQHREQHHQSSRTSSTFAKWSQPRPPTCAPNNLEWLAQYADGRDCEIFSIVLPERYCHMPFAHCTQLLFLHHQLILVAVFTPHSQNLDSSLGVRNPSTPLVHNTAGEEIPEANVDSRCFLNPSAVEGGYEIQPDSIGYVIAKGQPPNFRMFHSEDLEVFSHGFDDMVADTVSFMSQRAEKHNPHVPEADCAGDAQLKFGEAELGFGGGGSDGGGGGGGSVGSVNVKQQRRDRCVSIASLADDLMGRSPATTQHTQPLQYLATDSVFPISPPSFPTRLHLNVPVLHSTLVPLPEFDTCSPIPHTHTHPHPTQQHQPHHKTTHHNDVNTENFQAAFEALQARDLPDQLSDHCLIIGSLAHTLTLLHALHNSQYTHPCFSGIVFLHPTLPRPQDAAVAMRFPNVYFVKGSGHDMADLRKVHAIAAKAVFVRRETESNNLAAQLEELVQHSQQLRELVHNNQTNVQYQETWHQIAQPIKAALTVENVLLSGNNSRTFLCCEAFKTKHAELQSYTMSSGCLDALHPVSLSPAIVSGRVINHELWSHALLAQLVFKPFLSFLLPLLMYGQTITNAQTGSATCCSVELQEIPEAFYKQNLMSSTSKEFTFGQLFVFLLHKKMVAIGLLRNTFDAPLPYVHTAPDADLKLDDSDLVYVLHSWDWDGSFPKVPYPTATSMPEEWDSPRSVDSMY